MSSLAVFARTSLVLIVLAVALLPLQAQAQSKRDRAAADALVERMTAAEARITTDCPSAARSSAEEWPKA